jgi:hypothetical protein
MHRSGFDRQPKKESPALFLTPRGKLPSGEDGVNIPVKMNRETRRRKRAKGEEEALLSASGAWLTAQSVIS